MSEFPEGGADDVDSGPLVQCPDCSRSFAQDRLEKHRKVCKKVFMQKRKQFSSAANRLGELENAGQLIANAEKIEQEAHSNASKPKVEKKGEKVPEWKKKSLEFRAAMIAAKAATGDPEAQAKAQELQKEMNDAGLNDPDAVPAGMLKCPHCGRTFSQAAGERHIAICVKTFGNKNGGGRLVKGGGRGLGHQQSASGVPPVPDNRGAPRAGGAQQRKPSAHRTRP